MKKNILTILFLSLIFFVLSPYCTINHASENTNPREEIASLLKLIETDLNPLVIEFEKLTSQDEKKDLALKLLKKINDVLHLLMKQQHLFTLSPNEHKLIDQKITHLLKLRLRLFVQIHKTPNNATISQ